VGADASMSAWLKLYAAKPWSTVSRNGPPIHSRFYSFYGGDLTDREAVAIVESLTPLQ
jgi:hypothetical protein